MPYWLQVCPDRDDSDNAEPSGPSQLSYTTRATMLPNLWSREVGDRRRAAELSTQAMSLLSRCSENYI
jgi:hypothetical protein